MGEARPQPAAVWWQLIVLTIGPMIAIGAGFWSLADPRSELRQIKLDYLTIREHMEFATRTSKDIEHLQQDSIAQAERFLSTREFSEFRARVTKDIDRLEAQIVAANVALATIRELTAKTDALSSRIDATTRHLERLENELARLQNEISMHERLDRQTDEKRRKQ